MNNKFNYNYFFIALLFHFFTFFAEVEPKNNFCFKEAVEVPTIKLINDGSDIISFVKAHGLKPQSEKKNWVKIRPEQSLSFLTSKRKKEATFIFYHKYYMYEVTIDLQLAKEQNRKIELSAWTLKELAEATCPLATCRCLCLRNRTIYWCNKGITVQKKSLGLVLNTTPFN